MKIGIKQMQKENYISPLSIEKKKKKLIYNIKNIF
jgi:hypothetical protein